MHHWFYLFAASTLYSLPLLGMWANPVLEPKSGEPLVIAHKEGDLKVSLENDFGCGYVIKAAFYDNQLEAWQLPVNLSAADLNALQCRLAVDPKGNVIAAWQVKDTDWSLVQTCIFSRETNAWSAIHEFSDAGIDVEINHLGMDEAGNAFVSWTDKRREFDLFWSATYSKERDRWTRPRARKMQKEDNSDHEVLLDSNANSLVVRDKKNWDAYVVPLEQASLELIEKISNY